MLHRLTHVAVRVALSLVFVLAGLDIARASAADPTALLWPPPTGAANADASDYRLDPEYNPSGSATPMDGEAGVFGEALDVMEGPFPELVGEIRTAIATNAVAFVAIAPTLRGTGATIGDNCILLVLQDRSLPEICGTIAHEWEHIRGRCGKEGEPTTAEEEAAPCAELGAYVAGLEVIAIVGLFSFLETGDGEGMCSLWEYYYEQCSDMYTACLDAGGEPQGDCDSVPHLQGGPCR